MPEPFRHPTLASPLPPPTRRGLRDGGWCDLSEPLRQRTFFAPPTEGWREAPGWCCNPIIGSSSDAQRARIPRRRGGTPFSEKGVEGIRLRRFAPRFKLIAPQSGANLFDPLWGKGGRGDSSPRPRRAGKSKNAPQAQTFLSPLLVGGGRGEARVGR